MSHFIDMTGAVFGDWTVLGVAVRGRAVKVKWRVKCRCGNERVVAGGDLRNGSSTGCGCARNTRTGQRSRKHGGCRSDEYQIWMAMKARCRGKRREYGGRGIAVCNRWRHDFAAFLADMGPRPSTQHSIDRIDNDGDYGPDNCRWATAVEQANNKTNSRKLTVGGETLTEAQWAARAGILVTTLAARLGRGWSHDRAVLTPVRPMRRRK